MKQLKFVLTGVLSQSRDYFINLIEDAGHTVSKTVSVNTDYVVMGLDPGSKLDRANELGISVIDENRLLKILDKNSDCRVIYHFYTSDYGENEAMFDNNFRLLGAWHCNDANWRDEYFGPFMKKLGIIVKCIPQSKRQYALNALCNELGYDGDF